MKTGISFIVIAAIGWFLFIRADTVVLGPGVMAPDAPVQKHIDTPIPFDHKGYKITPLATYDISGKVLSRKNYSRGRESDLSNVDLAMGWGNMSDESILSEITISQSGRWYHWEVERFPIPRREIETHSANMHMVPANERIAAKIDEVRSGEIVRLSGKLVSIDGEGNWNWRSSLTRDDAGARACELMWVEEFSVQRSM